MKFDLKQTMNRILQTIRKYIITKSVKFIMLPMRFIHFTPCLANLCSRPKKSQMSGFTLIFLVRNRETTVLRFKNND